MNPWGVYQHWSPGKVIFGPNSLNELPNILGSADIPLVVTDKGVREAGILEKVADLLDGAGKKYHMFDGIVPTPPIQVIEEAAVAYRNHGCSSIIGLGGGSSIDGGKALSIRVSQEGSLREYGTGKRVEGLLPPIYAIPTTAGTGSEVTSNALISDDENRRKIIFRGEPQLIPRVAILDPLLLSSIPSRIAAETGADALTHAIEAYVSLNSNALTDAMAISAIKLVGRYLRRMVANPEDVEAAGHMLLASFIAGLAFQNAGLGLAHALANPLDVYCYRISHALLCALYLPVVMEFNIPACPEKFISIAEAMGEDVHGLSINNAAKLSVSAVRDLFGAIGIPKTFSEIGIQFSLKAEMINSVLVSPATKVNPRRSDQGQIARLFEAPQ